MLDIFNEEISEEDTDSTYFCELILMEFLDLLRFIGCNNETMTFEEFKLFFYKNL